MRILMRDPRGAARSLSSPPVSYTHLRAHETDFRSVYREVLERWLPSGDPEAVLGANYASFPLVGFLP